MYRKAVVLGGTLRPRSSREGNTYHTSLALPKEPRTQKEHADLRSLCRRGNGQRAARARLLRGALLRLAGPQYQIAIELAHHNAIPRYLFRGNTSEPPKSSKIDRGRLPATQSAHHATAAPMLRSYVDRWLGAVPARYGGALAAAPSAVASCRPARVLGKTPVRLEFVAQSFRSRG